MDYLCIYHANCVDGFTAAWVVNKAFPGIQLHPGVYQTAPPDVTGRDIVLVDFSYKRPVLIEMAKQAKSILILDHHKSAKEDLIDLPSNVTALFDMDRSGAMIAWNYYFPNHEPPQLLLHIQDRDLWKFELDGTREIVACIFSHSYTLADWEYLMKLPINTLFQEGQAIERKHFKDIHELLKVTQRRMIIGGYDVPVANLPYTYSSDAGHIMAEGEPFAACYWDTPTGRVFSLRSSNQGLDVSKIATQYGGGGHRNAAGFSVSREKAQEMEESKLKPKTQILTPKGIEGML